LFEEIAMINPILLIILFGIVTLLPWWKITSKVGYPGVLSLIILVPVANLIFLFWFAFTEWPVLRELRRMKEGGPSLQPSSAAGVTASGHKFGEENRKMQCPQCGKAYDLLPSKCSACGYNFAA
jgi:ribosomal protein L37E